jgi:predicted CXXCH cytochrome family protein
VRHPVLIFAFALLPPTAALAAPPTPASVPAKAAGPTKAAGPRAAPAASAAAAAPARAPASQKSGDEECLGCHEDSTDTVRFEDGSKLAVGVSRKALESSVHYRKVECVDCHKDAAGGYPHPQRKYKSRRAYAIARYEVCKRCHFANYTRTLESVHFRQLSQGNMTAPLCTDCHGTHDVKKPGQPRRAISDGCARCHAETYKIYAQSVHGAALREDNPDVPVCTDCHRAHDVVDPRSTAFRLREPTMCGGCHADEKRMAKYKLSTKVLKTYLNDFHGVTVSFRKKEKRPDITQFQAVCSDCHGVHDIRKSTDPRSSVMKANLSKTCRRCHKDATDNFPAAWLSHWEPSPKRAPLVFFIQKAYDILIPFIILGLLLHVLLHVWRVTINR